MTALRTLHPEQVSDPDSDPADGQWSQLELLVAMLLDETRFARWESMMSRLGKTDKKPKKPEPTPRPGVERKNRRPSLPPEVAEWLFDHMNGGSKQLPSGT